MRITALSTICACMMSSAALGAEIEIRRVSFENEGAMLAGALYLPADRREGEKLAGVIVTGAWTALKRFEHAT